MGTSELYLYGGAPFDPRYEHNIYWDDDPVQGKAKQDAFFEDLSYLAVADFRFIRKDSEININIPYDQCVQMGFNYACVINHAPFKKWYYFITNKRYVSNSVTALTVELDVIQTYQFDWEIPACFVEREHPLYDSPGLNLLPEGLELGEYIIKDYKDTSDLDELAIVCLTSVTMANPMGEPVTGSLINGVYHGLQMYTRTANATGAKVVNAALSALSTLGKADGVQAIWMYPKALIGAEWANEANEVMLPVTGMKEVIYSFNRPNNVSGYIPRNKKLLSYPYNFVYVHNNQGGAAAYHYERFGGHAIFKVTGPCSPDAVVRLIPEQYRGLMLDNESGLSLTGFPSCSWTQDAYKIWMAQTAASQDVQMLSANLTVSAGIAQSALGAGTALLTLGHSGTSDIAAGADKALSGYMQAQSILAAREDKQVQPPQAKGTQSGPCNVALKEQHFRICAMGINVNQAAALDEYFDMYGYQTNRVKTPNLFNRKVWNFVKTVGCVVLGPIDADDRRKIGAIFDKGITLWHEAERMYQYGTAASFNVAEVPE